METKHKLLIAISIILIIIVIGVLLIKIRIPLQLFQQKTITNLTRLSDNTFFVIYLYNKPNLTIYNEISKVFSKAIAANSSNAINVTFNVNLIRYNDLPIQLKQHLSSYTVYPVIGIISSKFNKDKAKIIPIIFDEINGMFIVKKDVLKYLYYHWGFTSIGEKIVIETNVMPSYDIIHAPIYGSPNARYYLFIYEDIYCPYCAKFYVETIPKINNLIINGTIAIVHKNLIIHTDAELIHRYLIAAYLESRNASAFFKVIGTLYNQVYNYNFENQSISLPDIEQVRNIVKKIIGVDPNITQYNDIISKILLEDSSEAVEHYWIYGTPGFVLWDREKDYGIIFVGFRSSNDIINIINSLSK